MNKNELQHYGVLGMKWGVRRNPSRAYAKAVRKKNVLERKSAKLAVKSAKYEKKSIRKEMHSTSESQYKKARKLHFKSNKLNLKSARLRNKGLKWEKQMEKVFSSYDIKRVPDGNIAAGKSFVYKQLYGNASYEVTKKTS